MPRLAPLVVAAWMLAGVALFGLAACNDSASAMESWPLDRSDSLLGPDLDGDGIRDDIRSIIDLHYPPAHRAQLYQSAKAFRLLYATETTDSQAVRHGFQELLRADNCLAERELFAAGDQLEAMHANTEQRLTHYLALNQAMDGTSWQLSVENNCDE